MSDDFAVRCKACGFTWNSAGMADGLRLIGSCPKCDGELEFAGAAAPATTARDTPTMLRPRGSDAAPHMVLGVPRR